MNISKKKTATPAVTIDTNRKW